MMTHEEHLLACLAEECGEVSKECHKALRFGMDDQVTLDPLGPRGTEGPTNREKIIMELNDLMGVVHRMVAFGFLPPEWRDSSRIARKVLKLKQYEDYARRIGSLEPKATHPEE